MLVLDNAINKSPNKEISPNAEALISDSYKNEAALYLHISNQKSIAQTKKIISLLEDIYSHIGEHITDISDDYEREHKILERTKNTDLSKFIDEQIKTCIIQFNKSAEKVKSKILEDVDSSIGISKGRIMNQFNDCQSVDSLKTFTGSTFSRLCSECGTEIMNKPHSDMKQFQDAFLSQINIFKENFKRNYKNLGLLPMDEKRLNVDFTSNKSEIVLASGNQASLSIEAAVADNNKKMGGGAAGAAIGTCLMPGVGTVIGGILGAIGGWLFVPDLNSLKSNARGSLTSSMDDYFNEIRRIYNDNLNQYTINMANGIKSEIHRYFDEYNGFVKEKIESDRKKKLVVERKIETVKADMKGIEIVKSELFAAREKLKQLNRRI